MSFDINFKQEFFSQLPKLNPGEFLDFDKDHYSVKKAKSESEAFKKVMAEAVKYLKQIDAASKLKDLKRLNLAQHDITLLYTGLAGYSKSLSKFFEQGAAASSVISEEETIAKKILEKAGKLLQRINTRAKEILSGRQAKTTEADFLSKLSKLLPDEYLQFEKTHYSVQKAQNSAEACQKVAAEVSKLVSQLELLSQSENLKKLKTTFEILTDLQSRVRQYSAAKDENAPETKMLQTLVKQTTELLTTTSSRTKEVLAKQQAYQVNKEAFAKKVKELKEKLLHLVGIDVIETLNEYSELMQKLKNSVNKIEKEKLLLANTEKQQLALARPLVKEIDDFVRPIFLRSLKKECDAQLLTLRGKVDLQEKDWLIIRQQLEQELKSEFVDELEEQIENRVLEEIGKKRVELEFKELEHEAFCKLKDIKDKFVAEIDNFKKKMHAFLAQKYSSEEIKKIDIMTYNPSKEPSKKQIEWLKLKELVVLYQEKIDETDLQVKELLDLRASSTMMRHYHMLALDAAAQPVISLEGGERLISMPCFINDIRTHASQSAALMAAAQEMQFAIEVDTMVRGNLFKQQALEKIIWALNNLPAYVAKGSIEPCVVVPGGYLRHDVRYMFQRRGNQYTFRIINTGEGAVKLSTQGAIEDLYVHDKIYTDLSIKQLSTEFFDKLTSILYDPSYPSMEAIYQFIEKYLGSSGGYKLLLSEPHELQLSGTCASSCDLTFLSIRAPDEFKEYYLQLYERLQNLIQEQLKHFGNNKRWQLMTYGTTSRRRIRQLIERVNIEIEEILNILKTQAGSKNP